MARLEALRVLFTPLSALKGMRKSLMVAVADQGVSEENFTEPPAVLEEGEEVYEVETILNHWKRG